MSFKRFGGVAAILALVTAPAFAQVPQISWDDNGDGTATLEVTPDTGFLPGSLAVELAVAASGGLNLTNAVLADGVTFDTPTPGDNPFRAGSPIGGDNGGTNGEGVDTGLTGVDGSVFASFGSIVIPSAGTFDLLTVSYTGSGTLTAAPNTGLLDADLANNGGDIVAQANVNFNVAPVELVIGGSAIPGDFDGDGDVDGADFGVFVGEFQTGDTGGPGASAPFSQADLNDSGFVDGADFGIFVDSFQNFPPPAVAVPEPTTMVLVAVGLAGVAARRRG